MKCKYVFGVALALIVASCLVQGSQADLKSDFHEFLALVPRNRIGYIAARHFIMDEQFRVALKYLRSSQFAQTWRRIRNTGEFLDLVGYLQTHNVSLPALQDVTAAIDKLPNQLRAFRIPSKVPVTVMMQRNLVSFMREVMQSMPRARFSGLMARKVSEGGDFARLYGAVKQEEFKQLVAKAKTSPNLAPSWRELRRNNIEINDFIQLAYEILSWGP
ncbi:protein G12 [Musca domestica]|uniref:Protein G12 n=1 Tax=Musca domestica TaxID=7370 RepID=A0A1I8MAL8_MUSDO|nr:protein G12 [Musca domestica]